MMSVEGKEQALCSRTIIISLHTLQHIRSYK